MAAQIVYRAIESLDTARAALGSQVMGTFLRWRFEQDVLLLVMGLGNLKGGGFSRNGLKLKEDGIAPSEWYREGRYPTVLRNNYRNSIIGHRWGPHILAESTRAMCDHF